MLSLAQSRCAARPLAAASPRRLPAAAALARAAPPPPRRRLTPLPPASRTAKAVGQAVAVQPSEPVQAPSQEPAQQAPPQPLADNARLRTFWAFAYLAAAWVSAAAVIAAMYALSGSPLVKRHATLVLLPMGALVSQQLTQYAEQQYEWLAAQNNNGDGLHDSGLGRVETRLAVR
jgi:hypothetical protein